MIYYRRYLPDYHVKTTRLSMLEHGAYSMMLDAYYIEEEPLPLPVHEIYEICKATTPEACAAVDKVLAKYFKKQRDGWHNKRADEEIAAAKVARENGSKGGRPKTRNGTGTETHDETQTGTGEGGRNGTTTNHQPPASLTSSTTNPQPAGAAEHERQQQIDAGTKRGEMAKALRDAGVTGVTPSHPQIVEWINAGVTVQLLKEAVELARQQKPKPQPIPVNYLVPIVERLRGGQQQAERSSPRPWFIDSWTAIVAKGKDLALEQREGESAPEFKNRVFEAAGVTAEEVRKAEKEFGR